MVLQTELFAIFACIQDNRRRYVNQVALRALMFFSVTSHTRMVMKWVKACSPFLSENRVKLTRVPVRRNDMLVSQGSSSQSASATHSTDLF